MATMTSCAKSRSSFSYFVLITFAANFCIALLAFMTLTVISVSVVNSKFKAYLQQQAAMIAMSATTSISSIMGNPELCFMVFLWLMEVNYCAWSAFRYFRMIASVSGSKCSDVCISAEQSACIVDRGTITEPRCATGVAAIAFALGATDS